MIHKYAYHDNNNEPTFLLDPEKYISDQLIGNQHHYLHFPIIAVNQSITAGSFTYIHLYLGGNLTASQIEIKLKLLIDLL